MKVGRVHGDFKKDSDEIQAPWWYLHCNCSKLLAGLANRSFILHIFLISKHFGFRDSSLNAVNFLASSNCSFICEKRGNSHGLWLEDCMALYLQAFVLIKFDIDRANQSSSFYVVYLLHGNGGVWKLSERTWRKKQLIHQQKKKEKQDAPFLKHRNRDLYLEIFPFLQSSYRSLLILIHEVLPWIIYTSHSL